MKLRSTLFSAALLTALPAVSALSKITRSGRFLYDDNGERFFIKGIAYQQQGQVTVTGAANPLGEPTTFVDNLADGAGCSRDLPNLQKLGANAIRAYSVDSTLDHDSCMNALSGAGIYVILDLTLPLNGSIDTTQPTWSTSLLNEYINTIDVFSKYDNVLAYNVGNEVLTASATSAAPFIKAAARDIKAYLTKIGSSALVGYADIDGPSAFRDAVAEYLACDPSNKNDGSTSIDLFGLNNYEWCGDAPTSTYNSINTEFENYNIVAYFSEYGSETCNPGVRPWTEVATLFAEPMAGVWSGGLAFSYFNATANNEQFGMVTLSSDNSTATTNQDFANLVAQYASLTALPNNPTQAAAPSATYTACPSEGTAFEASTTLPPTPNTDACECLSSALACQFVAKGDFTDVIGTLTGQVCSFLAQNGGSCADISANGTSGVYGTVSSCDPVTRLSYEFTQYYEATGRLSTSCDFAGNATLSTSSSVASSVSDAVSSCLTSPSAVFTPSASSGAPAASSPSGGSSSGSSSGGGSSGSGSGKGSGAVAVRVGVLTSVLVGVVGGVALVLA
ncbi:1,3-beta-glucanosyltransferase [Mycena chlorophos]|uniref:1,3-beta-glucanosyltransferase n=1 Tax=Mycena chlorophos TaxID=658473 RepID=A0A8H6TKG1_MYCCL|nr:1,3-beta-glucanosyltransferase [Mycena chlorophos]